MIFPHATSIVRERRRLVTDPYNPDRTVQGGWEDSPERLELAGFISSTSSSPTRDAARSQIDSVKYLYLDDAAADVRPGDRIVHPDGVGYVRALPAADTNPFTSWQPVREVVLYETEG